MGESIKLGFVPKIKSRRRFHTHTKTRLFPRPADKEKWSAVFTGFSVEVARSETNNICSLYENGCFGKGSHSRSFPLSCGQKTTLEASSFDEVLVLDLEEAFFLAYFLSTLNIVDLNNVALDREQAFNAFQLLKPNFVYTLAAYIYFKSKGWVIKSGTKFGGDFLLYKQSTRLYHASFIAIVLPEGKIMHAKDLQGMHRIAETSDKDLVLLNVCAPGDVPPGEHYNYIHSFKVTETIPRRFDFKKHVQSK